MDDLASRLNELLKDPESMEKIKNLASMFGGKEAPEDSPAPRQGPQQNRQPQQKAPQVDPEAMRAVMKIAPVLSRFRQEDDATRLLRALRPFLGETRRKKLDEAIRLMQFVRMIPTLKNSGIF